MLANGIVRDGVRVQPQFGHILKSNSLRPLFRHVRRTNTKLLQLPQIHSRFTKQGTVSPPELDFARNRKQLRQPVSRGEFYANFIGMS